jgi:hypothetical protein
LAVVAVLERGASFVSALPQEVLGGGAGRVGTSLRSGRSGGSTDATEDTASGTDEEHGGFLDRRG